MSELNDMLNSSPETAFLGKSSPTPAPSPTPRPSRFSMTDRMNSALGQAFKLPRMSSVMASDPLASAMQSPSRNFMIPAAGRVNADMLAEVPPSLNYQTPYQYSSPRQNNGPRLSYPVMRWTTPVEQQIPGLVYQNNFGF